MSVNKPSQKAFANGSHDLKRGVDFIGVTCSFICHDGQGNVLMHKRSQNCRDEQGRWDFGGGAHEFGSTLEATVRREIKEEYGADVLDLKRMKIFDVHRQLDDGTPTHWVAINFAARLDPKQVRNNEPHKIDEIGWFKPHKLPKPLHSQAKHQLDTVLASGLI